MRWRTRSLVAVGLSLGWSAPALACGLWPNYTFIAIPSGPMISVGLQNVENYRIIAASATFKAGDKAAITPIVGHCAYTGSGASGGDVTYGANVAYQVWKDAAGKVSVNAQAGVELLSYDGGNERNIPVGAVVGMSASEMLDIFGGVLMSFYNDSYGGSSYSSTDPAITAGAAYKTGKIRLTGGVTMYMYDGGSEMAINVAGGMALGSASNAIRNLFRR